MKICIVIQSDAFRTSAGMRIRYDRFRKSLDPSQVSIDAITCADLSASKRFDHDVYIFCKTFDMAALLLARRLWAAGKTVGQDLFDDYFSQYSDQRLERFRQWQRDMVPVTHFAVTTTPRMAEVLKDYMPETAITVIEDPIEGFDPALAARLADAKIARARDSKVLDIAWFGIGDNPYFPVGLIDLAACDPELARIQRLGWDVRLRIVTNRRPFEGAGAEVLRRLSVGFEVVEWSEETERQELEAAAVAIIPVNGQSFSRAKSMNRAVTAINAGCQVLSLGFPLYERLANFIYDEAEPLLADIDAGTPRIGSATIDALSARLTELADPDEAATRFVEAARDGAAAAAAEQPRRTVCVLHGRSSAVAIHKAVGALGGLSVSTIFTKGGWNFPVRFDRSGRDIVMRVTPKVGAEYNLPLIGERTSRILDNDFVEVDTGALRVRPLQIDLPAQTNPILDLALYEDVMKFAQECCVAAFPSADVLISDTSPFARKPASPPILLPKAPSALAKVIGHGPVRRRSFRGFRRSFGGSDRAALKKARSLVGVSNLFDREFYLRTYPDVAESGVDPLDHFLKLGWREGRNPSPAFCTNAYLKANQDVAALGLNPLVHYLEHGQAEGRKAPAAKGSKVQ